MIRIVYVFPCKPSMQYFLDNEFTFDRRDARVFYTDMRIELPNVEICLRYGPTDDLIMRLRGWKVDCLINHGLLPNDFSALRLVCHL